MSLEIGRRFRSGLLITAALGLGIFVMGSHANADSDAAFKEKIDALQKKVEVLEKKQAESGGSDASSKTSSAKSAQKGYFVIPGTDTEMKISMADGEYKKHLSELFMHPEVSSISEDTRSLEEVILAIYKGGK